MNTRIDIEVTKKQLVRWLDYLEESGYKVVEKWIDGAEMTYVVNNLDWNYGVVGASILGPDDKWKHYIPMRVPKNEPRVQSHEELQAP